MRKKVAVVAVSLGLSGLGGAAGRVPGKADPAGIDRMQTRSHRRATQVHS